VFLEALVVYGDIGFIVISKKKEKGLTLDTTDVLTSTQTAYFVS